MPTTPFASVLCSLNGGALTSGGLAAPSAATVQLSGANTAGWTSVLWQMTDYPTGFTAPAGWSTDAGGIIFYAGITPPVFTLPAIATRFGKWMLKLTVNGGIDEFGVFNPAKMIDTATAVQTLSPKGQVSLGAGEGTQFSGVLKGWAGEIQKEGVAIESALGAIIMQGIIDGASGAVAIGDCISVTSTGTMTRAVLAALNLSGAVLGVATSAGAAGSPVSVQIDGLLSPSLSGVSSFGPVRCNTTTGRCEVVVSFSAGDFPVGFSNAAGYVTMVRQVNNPVVVFTYASIGGLMVDLNGNVGATVSQWTDQTANGNNLVQATALNQPVIITGGLNGLKTVRFDGTASFMRAASFLLNRNEITVIAVSSLRVEGSNPHLATYGGASNLGRLYYSAASGNALLQRGATNAVWTADQAGLGFKITTFMCRNDGTNELFIGGTSRATFTDATAIPVSAAFDIGAYNNGAGFFAPIDYARILVYNKALTTAQRTQIEAQLSADYGV